jgi:hypothetical protein
MTFPNKLEVLHANQAQVQELLANVKEEDGHDFDVLMDLAPIHQLQSSKWFPVTQGLFAAMIQSNLGFRSLEVPNGFDDEEIEVVSLDEFLKARGADDFLMDNEETEKQKAAYEKYSQLHVMIDEKMKYYTQVLDKTLERMTCIRPLFANERAFRVRNLKGVFQHLKRKINYAYVEVPGSYISKRRKRGSLPRNAVRILKKWLFEHFSHPYPSMEEKESLSIQTGLKASQVNYWFINARVRIWKPMIGKMKN